MATTKQASGKESASPKTVEAFLVRCPKVTEVYKVLTGSTKEAFEGYGGGHAYSVTIVQLTRSRSSKRSKR